MSAYPAMRQLPAGLALSIAFVLVTSPCVLAATIVVPDDLPTIQGAILAAADGDTVLVQPGTYLENINYRGKAIALIARGGPAVTTIDGSHRDHPDSATVVTIPATPGPVLPTLEGFTITGGGGTTVVPCSRRAGGVFLLTAAVVRGNDITENHMIVECDVQASTGAGMEIVEAGASVITHNRIFSNTAPRGSLDGTGRGGGVRIVFAEGQFSHNEIFDNVSGGHTGGNGSGGGVFFEGTADLTFEYNVIACNVASRSGGGVYEGAEIMRNNTIVGNEAILVPQTAGFDASPAGYERNAITHNLGGGGDCSAQPTGDCNNFYGNTGGDPGCVASNPTNISVDPLYADDSCGGSFCLLPGSPMLPENSPPGCGLIGARRLCGQTTSAGEGGAPAALRSGVRAYPNPFNPATTIAFELMREEQVTLEVMTTGGRKVARVLDTFLTPGLHEVRWDGRREDGSVASSGAYIVVLRTGSASRAQKVLLLK